MASSILFRTVVLVIFAASATPALAQQWTGGYIAGHRRIQPHSRRLR